MASIVKHETKLPSPEVAFCVPGGSRLRLRGTGVSAAVRPLPSVARAAGGERLMQAHVAVAAQADAYVAAANGAGASQIFGQQKTQLHTMWALRGLDPWSDPT